MTDELNELFTKNTVDSQDVKQIAAIREWETGKKQNLRIIFNELASGDRMLYFGNYSSQLEEASVPWEQDEVPHNVVETLVDWTLQQEDKIQAVVFSFLDAPNKEELLPEVLAELGLEIKTNIPTYKPNRKSMTDIMRDSLPASKEDLIVLIQSVSPETRRPAATVRQWLRTDTRKGKIYLNESDGLYYHV